MHPRIMFVLTLIYALKLLEYIFLRAYLSCLPEAKQSEMEFEFEFVEKEETGYFFLHIDCDPLWYIIFTAIVFCVDMLIFVYMVRNVSKLGPIHERLIKFLAIPFLCELAMAISFVTALLYLIISDKISLSFIVNTAFIVLYVITPPIWWRNENKRRAHEEDPIGI